MKYVPHGFFIWPRVQMKGRRKPNLPLGDIAQVFPPKPIVYCGAPLMRRVQHSQCSQFVLCWSGVADGGPSLNQPKALGQSLVFAGSDLIIAKIDYPLLLDDNIVELESQFIPCCSQNNNSSQLVKICYCTNIWGFFQLLPKQDKYPLSVKGLLTSRSFKLHPPQGVKELFII